jgi:Mn2+/Fe2+ NRAMP family transporter
VPYLYADFYGVVKQLPPDERQSVVRVTSTPYRLALIFITIAPLPFAFMRSPLFIIITYTIVGSMFVPFLAATLLYLNNRVKWAAPIPRNHWTTNVLLVVILALFVVVGVQEIANRL